MPRFLSSNQSDISINVVIPLLTHLPTRRGFACTDYEPDNKKDCDRNLRIGKILLKEAFSRSKLRRQERLHHGTKERRKEGEGEEIIGMAPGSKTRSFGTNCGAQDSQRQGDARAQPHDARTSMSLPSSSTSSRWN